MEESIMAKVELDTRAPEFTLDDFKGNSVSLSDFSDRKNVLVVFNRGFF
jgi:peroxiredoxin